MSRGTRITPIRLTVVDLELIEVIRGDLWKDATLADVVRHAIAEAAKPIVERQYEEIRKKSRNSA